mgnify:CR=1 FL=1
MKLIAQVSLLTSQEDMVALRNTLEVANAACNDISSWAWDNKEFGQYALHRSCYHNLRAKSGLSAQIVVRCVARVADAYKLDRKKLRQFKKHGAIAYDDRILSWKLDRHLVSIWTTAGRIKIPFVCGERQFRLLAHRQGESDLVYVDGRFYFLATCNVVDPTSRETKDFLGVDLGIANIAVDSDGENFSGGQIKGLRRRHADLRATLQAKGTKSAKRLLRKRSRKESRFARDVNHVISKRLVTKAEDTDRGIALEDLKGIRDRITVRRSQRRSQNSWSFNQLRTFVEYKATLAGVVVVLVDPRHTSQTCPVCRHCGRDNRPTRNLFRCTHCGLSGHADYLAALNIRGRAEVNRPHAVAA